MRVLPILSKKHFPFAIHARVDADERLCLEDCLLCHLEHFNFFGCEIGRTRENRSAREPCVVRVTFAKEGGTLGVDVAVIRNTHDGPHEIAM
jgi:hypothetical protein